jgi:hypothetical protein
MQQTLSYICRKLWIKHQLHSLYTMTDGPSFTGLGGAADGPSVLIAQLHMP